MIEMYTLQEARAIIGPRKPRIHPMVGLLCGAIIAGLVLMFVAAYLGRV